MEMVEGVGYSWLIMIKQIKLLMGQKLKNQ